VLRPLSTPPPGVAALAIALLAAACGGRGAPEIDILGAAVELPQTFLGVDCVVELPNGRVLVLDTKARSVQVADFAAKTLAMVGRPGRGPGEYAQPDWLIPIPNGGDTTLIDDAGNARYAVAVDDRLTTATFPRDPHLTAIRAVDRRGRAYLQPELNTGDSAPVMRLDRADHEVDTAAFISTGRVTRPRPHRFVWVKLPPYPKNDAWGVLSDGTVMIARIGDYHVEAVPPHGKRRTGAPVPFERIRNEWGDSEPPFVSSPTPADRVSPDGFFWVERTTPEHEKPERFDVFDADGRLVREVSLPLGARLVGLGRGVVYVTTTDAAGAVHLDRAPLVPGTPAEDKGAR